MAQVNGREEREPRQRVIGGQITPSANNSLALAEIDQQIATAHAFPRSVTKFRTEALELVTLTRDIAEECMYALPRGGKTIEGPSARFAEVIASCWGNSRAGARVVGEQDEFIVAQGAFHDLERNVAINYEVKRRITNRDGRRYDADMIAVTANAACSIALRNAVLKGVPKAFWSDIYEAARNTVKGDTQTLDKRRNEAISFFTKKGISEQMICQALNVKGVKDIGLDELVTLRAIANSIKNGEYTIEDAFTPQGVTGIEEAEAASAPSNDVVMAAIQRLGKDLGMNTAQINARIGQANNLADLEVELVAELKAKKAGAQAQQTATVDSEESTGSTSNGEQAASAKAASATLPFAGEPKKEKAGRRPF